MSVGSLDRLAGRPALLAQAFELSPVAKAVISLGPGTLGLLAEVNDAFCALFGHSRAGLTGQNCDILYAVQDRPEIQTGLRRLAAGERRPAVTERAMVRRDGSTVWAATLASVAHDTGGTPYVIAEVVEIGARHAAEEQFRAAFDAGLLGMAIATEDGRLRRVNAAFEALTGRPAADLIGRQIMSLTHPEGTEYRIARPDGTVAWARVAMSTIHGPDGTVDRLVQCEDVTGRRMAENLAERETRRLRVTAEQNRELLHRANEAVQAIELERTAALAAFDKLARSERRFAEVFDHSPVPGIVIGLRGTDRGRVLLANPAFRRLAGGTGDLRFPELAQAADDLEPGWDGPRPIQEAALRRADGTSAVVAVHLLAITDDRGPRSAVVQLRDVTAEREARAALSRSEEQFRTAFDGSPVGLLIADEHGLFQRANPAAAALTGRPVSELVGLTHREITDPADLEVSARARLALQRGADGVCYDKRLRHADGRSSWTRVTLSLIPGPAGRVWRLVQLQDITAERAAAEAREREVRRLRATLAVQREVTAAAGDRDSALRVVAARSVDLFDAADGSAVELARGDQMHYQATAGTLGPYRGTNLAIGGSLSGRVLVTGTPAYCADSRTDQRVDREACARLGIASMMIVPLRIENQVIGVLKVCSGRVDAFDETDGEQLALLADSLGSALRHADDAARNATLLDERTRALAALEGSNRELEAANRLKLDLIGMLGHEIGNPLSSIRGYAEILSDAAASPESPVRDGAASPESPVRDGAASLRPAVRDRAIEAIARQAGRLDEIVREVLAMVSIDAGAITAVRQELHVRAEVAKALVATELERVPVLGPDARILCNPGHLQQILVNLLSNATKYGGGATAVTITAADGTGYVAIRVEDDGPGVPDEFRLRLFERLTRADRDAARVRGTGLGLYIVRGLAQANHGDVRHEPNPSGGSRFIVDLETPAACQPQVVTES